MRQLDNIRVFACSIAIATSLCIESAVAQTENSTGTAATRLWIAEPGDTGLNRWDSRQLFEESGDVLDWNSKAVVVRRPRAKTSTTIPGDNVVRIEPAWANDTLEKIHRAFQQRQFDAVVKEGLVVVSKAKNGDLPLWQVQVILA